MVPYVKYIFNAIRFILLFFTLSSCSFLSLPDSVKPITPNSIVSVKGTILHFISGQGRVYPGTYNHSGYVLKYPIWESVYDVENKMKFVEPDSIAKKFEGKEVFVSGYFERVPTFYYENRSSRAGYDVIHIDTIYAVK